MTDVAPPQLPFEQRTVLDMPHLLRQLQAERPIVQVRTPVGDQAWLVTRYQDVKPLLGDPRLGRSHPDPEHAPRITRSILFGGPMEPYETEHADHAQMRALLTPFFSARRMEALRPRVASLVDGLLDDMAQREPPIDLHAALSFPLPVLVICELLGVPFGDRQQFHEWSTAMADLHDPDVARAALNQLVAYMTHLVVRKRTQPTDDVLSGLCAVLEDQHAAFLGAMLLFAGHETTVVRIDMGALVLLTQPAARQALQAEPRLVPAAVEELLRFTNTGTSGITRYVREDIAIGDVTMRAGEAVLLSTGAADHDAAVFDEPFVFNARRQPNQHLTFGHGSRFCIGAPLARLELQEVFGRLTPRFPDMRLAQPIEELKTRDVLTGGIEELWVTW